MTVLATGRPHHLEDQICATYIADLVKGNYPALDLTFLRSSDRYLRLAAGTWPGFPSSDLDLALSLDRFSFAMEVAPRDGCFHVSAVSP